MPSSGFSLRPSVRPIHRGGVRWKRGGGHTTQTWHSNSPNDYNMLNLISSPPSCKFSKRRLTYISAPCSEFRKKKKFFKPQVWSENCNSLFSHCLLQEANPPPNPASRAFVPLTKTTRMKTCIHWRYKLQSGAFIKKISTSLLKQHTPWINQLTMLDILDAFAIATAKVQSNTNTVAMEISDKYMARISLEVNVWTHKSKTGSVTTYFHGPE